MKKRTFYLTMGFFLICLIGIALAIRDINTTEPQSEEGELMGYTCDEVKSYETLAAEQDLDELRALLASHANEYSTESSRLINVALADLDSVRDEVAFHNTDEGYYNSHFRNILREISLAELSKAQKSLSKGQQDAALESVRQAQHCLHDALIFSSEEEVKTDMGLLHQLNELKNNGLTDEGLEKVVTMLAG